MEYSDSNELDKKYQHIKKTLQDDSAFETLFKESILEYFKNIEDKNLSIVDIGAGNGALISALRKLDFSNISALDFDNYLKFNDEVPFYKIDLSKENIPLASNSVDIITCIQVIEHIENPWHFVREAYRVLKQNGILLISFPTSKDVFSRFKFLLRGDVHSYTEKNNHISFFTNAIQNKLFKNFKILDEKFTLTPISNLRIYPMRVILRRVFRITHFPKRKFFSIKTLFIMKKDEENYNNC